MPSQRNGASRASRKIPPQASEPATSKDETVSSITRHTTSNADSQSAPSSKRPTSTLPSHPPAPTLAQQPVEKKAHSITTASNDGNAGNTNAPTKKSESNKKGNEAECEAEEDSPVPPTPASTPISTVKPGKENKALPTNHSITKSDTRNAPQPHNRPSISLNIHTLLGKTIPVEVFPTDTILDIKKQIYHWEGLPIHSQSLIFGEKVLADYLTVSETGLRNESTLKLVMQLAGGPGPPVRFTTQPSDEELVVLFLCKKGGGGGGDASDDQQLIDQDEDVFMIELPEELLYENVDLDTVTSQDLIDLITTRYIGGSEPGTSTFPSRIPSSSDVNPEMGSREGKGVQRDDGPVTTERRGAAGSYGSQQDVPAFTLAILLIKRVGISTSKDLDRFDDFTPPMLIPLLSP
ncbi:hypothetical protein HK102_002300 [Quaeritorhiza haematococci]|nr:hypothetical protein HK102_002300 [Quaeritorhiza haematococci]